MDPGTVVLAALAAFDAGVRDFGSHRALLTQVVDQAAADGDEHRAALAARLLPVLLVLEHGDRAGAVLVFADAVTWGRQS